MRVGDIGERGVLQRLLRFCPADVVGDDAALISVSPGHQLVVTADTLVDGVHFSWGLANPDIQTTRPCDAGWRAAAANLSDLAAMGAKPLGITVSLGLPAQMEVADLEALYQGLVDCLTPVDVAILGGDVCRSPVLSVAITALGEVRPHQAIRRSTAQPGDWIVATGYHGASRAGLEILLNPAAAVGLRESDRQFLITAHQRPAPRLDVISTLHRLQCDDSECSADVATDGSTGSTLSPGSTLSEPWAIAGMDSSDGLADAVLQLCQASQVGAVLDRAAVPIPPVLSQWRSPEEALRWALYGGEDFELVLCCPPSLAQRLVAALSPPAAIIGHIVAGDRVVLRDPSSGQPDEGLQISESFQHFG